MSKFAAIFLTVTLFLAALAPLAAQQPFSGTPDLYDSLHKVNELGTVLMIAAHPDDERTNVLAYFARGRHMRTAYLSLTRGEGGQNLIGSEQGAQLGLIRTQELLAARKIDGAEQFFTRAIDFGFTKTASETLEKWGHDRILGDIVWVIRNYRPDVIILGFSGTPRDGHGQHQVSAILGKEAFSAAADPARFPEQLRFVKPWRTRRLVQAEMFFGPPPTDGGRAGRGGRAGQPAGSASVERGEVDTGSLNPILGYSYEELAVLSRSMHHSQGTGAMRRVGPAMARFSVLEGDPLPGAGPQDLFAAIDSTWNRLPGGAAVAQMLGLAIREFDPSHPEKLVPQLAKTRPLIAAINDPLAAIKLHELDELLAQCAGVWVEAQAQQPEAIPGTPFSVTTTVMNRSNADVSFESASMEGIWDQKLNAAPAALPLNESVRATFTGEVPVAQPYSQPFWLVKPPSGDVYTVDDQKLIGLADTPAPASVRVRLKVGGAPVEIVRAVHYRYADRAEGERTRPIVVVPPVAVNLPDPVTLFPAAEPRKVHVAVMANVAGAAGDLRLDVPAGWSASPGKQSFRITTAGEQQELVFDVTPPAAEATARLGAIATVSGREIPVGMQIISYTHIPTQTLFPPADLKLVRANVKVTVKHVGYIMGAGDEMPGALKQLGLEVTPLTTADLAQGDLSRFDAIVAGVRAYNVRADLRANQPRLLEYVRNGGTYVVQYQTGDSSLNLGPYPFTVPPGSGYRVTVEDAPVTFPHPDSLLLTVPNHISPRDFEGWVQERGLYFSTQWDPQYQTVIASHDPGEQPLEGGELWTRYGKGVYIFTAYDWFRQLPAGVPGGFRLFANLISAK